MADSGKHSWVKRDGLQCKLQITCLHPATFQAAYTSLEAERQCQVGRSTLCVLFLLVKTVQK